jgi:hypothetical protein
MTISAPALRRLQALFAQFARRSFDITSKREDRLFWAAQTLGHEVTSFSELSAADGKKLIDDLQAWMGIAETAPPRRQRKSMRERQKVGTEGRRDQIHPDVTMLEGTEDVLGHIQREMTALSMDEERLRAFLRSPFGPNNGRDTIRTLGDANRVHFALKRMARRSAVRAAHPASRRNAA